MLWWGSWGGGGLIQYAPINRGYRGCVYECVCENTRLCCETFARVCVVVVVGVGVCVWRARKPGTRRNGCNNRTEPAYAREPAQRRTRDAPDARDARVQATRESVRARWACVRASALSALRYGCAGFFVVWNACGW